MTGWATAATGPGPVDAVVLAAGESRRMGRPKMLLPWGEGTVLEAVVRSLLAAPVRRAAVVLGHRAAEHRAALRSLEREGRVLLVENPRYREGMLTSAQCGVAALLRAGAGTDVLPGGVPACGVAACGAPPCGAPPTVLIALGDQPLITPAVVARVAAGHRGGLTVPTFGGRRGHPLCVDGRLLGDLLALPPEEGLRGLFRRHPGAVTQVAVESDAILLDVDTPAAYREALEVLGRERAVHA